MLAVVRTLRSLGSAASGALAQAGAVGDALLQARREGRAHSPRPPDAGLVLEVGGGQAPHPRADLVVDKYPFDDFERPGEAGLDVSHPLVVADGEALPFVDGAFGYCIASHVLEHAVDPAQFAGELGRVAAAGFVQVPSRESELTFGWPYHPWLIDLVDGCLAFSPKGDQRAPLGEVFHEEFGRSPVFRLWWASTRSRWHHSVEWSGRLPVRVEGTSQAERTASVDVERTAWALRDLVARGAGPPPPGAALRAALRCPVCRGALVEEGERLACRGCGAGYPLAGTVPILLEGAGGA